jgi:hypothetical protein
VTEHGIARQPYLATLAEMAGAAGTPA